MKRIVLGILLVLAGIVVSFTASIFNHSLAAATPKITWAPGKLSESVSPLETKSLFVSFTSSTDLSDVLIRVVPELEPYLKTEPSIIPTVRAGIAISVKLTLAAAADAPLRIIDGTIQLRSIKMPTKTYARPLPITLQIGKKFAYENFSFLYPTFGRPSEEVVKVEAGNTKVDIRFLSATGEDYVSQFGFILYQNQNYLSLIDWFRQNVDLTGMLVSMGSFSLQVLPNGLDVLVHSGPIPREHLDQYGPVADFYAVTPDRAVIIIMSKSQENEFDIHGYNPEAQKSLLLAILQSMQF